MKKLLILFLLLSFRQIIAQPYIHIPDPNFAAYLHDSIPIAMLGNSLNISSPLVTTTKTITVPYRGILNLSGIEYFTSLTYLNCSYNYYLTSYPPLPVTIQTLYCAGNSLTNLPALPNAIQTLVCDSNALSNLSLSGLPNTLLSLSCTYNSLTSLPALPSSLQKLNCNNNSLTSLPTLPNTLQTLYCYQNNIACFPVFPASITSINLFNNPITCLPNYLSVSVMGAYLLNFPLCAAGNVNGCPVSQQVGIKEFNLNDNDITIYPNPTSDKFTIETNSTEQQTMNLLDLNGKLLLTEELNGKTAIDVSSLSAGVYNLSIKIGEMRMNKKLVILK